MVQNGKLEPMFILILENNLKIKKLYFEDYSEKVYKLIVPIKKDTYEAEKFIFIPKSKVKELKNDIGYSFRNISEYFKKYHRFSIAHTTIQNKWKKLEN
mgnify:CR=1 FL=1